jgi:hypothetical protein
VKISKQKLRQIIKEEIEAHQLQKKSMRDHAMEKIDELQDEEAREAILAYITSLEGGIQGEQ